MPQEQYDSLMKMLRQLKREDAEFKNWAMLYIYDYRGKVIGFTITVHGKEKES